MMALLLKYVFGWLKEPCELLEPTKHIYVLGARLFPVVYLLSKQYRKALPAIHMSLCWFRWQRAEE